jgi:Fe-Mn family superoxide dismutase
LVLVPERLGLSEIDRRGLPYRELPGLSAKLLRDHYLLYEGYVKRLNALERLLEKVADKWAAARIASEVGFLRNAVVLHELYFGNMTPGGRGQPSDVLPSEFASRWEKHFRLVGSASTGWMVLAYDPRTKTLIDFPMTEHGRGYVAGAVPILVMDVYEHAYMAQYGLAKDAYIDAFFKNIDWKVVRDRLRKAHASAAD